MLTLLVGLVFICKVSYAELLVEQFDLRLLNADELVERLIANDARFNHLRIDCNRTNYRRPFDGAWRESIHATLNGYEPPPVSNPDRIDTSLFRYAWAIRDGDVAAEFLALEPKKYNPISRWKVVGTRFDEVFGCHDNGFMNPLVWEHRTRENKHRCTTGDERSVAELKNTLGVGFGKMIVKVLSWEAGAESGRLVAEASKWPGSTCLLTATLGPELVAHELDIELEHWHSRVTTNGLYVGPRGLRCAASGAFHGKYHKSKRLGEKWDVTVNTIEEDPKGELWDELADHRMPNELEVLED
ncbi:hypothetical protein [Botrimarina hoheduenensis]|uniref:Uncharacterized protein n=1 Tax=Botrimarina hoheduenensis TaxID=2528000 RepID=A0A5C5WDV3_9BACT|nr:hypothetical protein [Botrimarina hoheduenensis]TWT48323.1 hypothetical protein Pla111_00860 [Botrimarina hoheduenensis]